jgi:hypothetical protein
VDFIHDSRVRRANISEGERGVHGGAVKRYDGKIRAHGNEILTAPLSIGRPVFFNQSGFHFQLVGALLSISRELFCA